MTIGQYIKLTDIETYKRLIKLCSKTKDKKEIKLGDSPENLMKANAYKRVNRRIRQVRWE